MAYSFFGSCIILFVINLIPGLHLRIPEEDEILGVDDAEIGEFAVSAPIASFEKRRSNQKQYDYVEITRDVIGGTTPESGEVSSKRTMTPPNGNEESVETKA